MKIFITGGGTAGHINPAIAIADYIKNKNPNWEFFYVGNPNHMEYKLAVDAGYNFIGINVKGFKRKISITNVFKNFKAASLLLTASYKSRKILKKYKPDLIIGTGGYVTGPIMNEAVKMGIKTITHEQNAYPGVTTKLLSKKVDKVLLAVEDAKKFLNLDAKELNNKVKVTGNPIRRGILTTNRSTSRQKLGIQDDDICIVSFGGSLGARPINKSVAGLIFKTYKNNNIYHIHATGKFDAEFFLKILKQKGVKLTNAKNIDVREYINNMDECLAAADIVICRAGAITISEIEAVGRASILIPSPYVAENHQYYNAKVLADRDAAILIEEKNLTDEELYFQVNKLINNKEKVFTMGENARSLAVIDANERIYNIVCEVLSSNVVKLEE